MKLRKCLVSVFFAGMVSSVVAASAPVPPAPESWPLCPNPQNIGPTQMMGGSTINSKPSPIVWNGRDYATVWVDGADYRLHFRRFFADGTPAGPTTTVSTLQANIGPYPVSLVWNGNGYAAAWSAGSPSGFYQVYFALINADGTMIGTEVKVSNYGATDASTATAPALAWSGSQYAVVWQDDRSGLSDIYTTVLDGAGVAVVHDILLTYAANSQIAPTVAWSRGRNLFVAIWEDYRSGTKYELWSATFTSGGVSFPGAATVSGTNSSYGPVLADSGSGLGLVWFDYRDANYEIYFKRLAANGSSAGTDLRLTNDANFSWAPSLVWTGAEYGVFWADTRAAGSFDLWFQRVSAAGAAVGSNTQFTFAPGIEYPAAAFGHYGYLVTGTGFNSGPNFVLPLGCALDTTAPTCPSSLMAYNITGTTATVSWLPSLEDATDIAYYQLYRNNAPIAKTSATYYADSGLALSTTYKYDVWAVNALGLTSSGCGSASSLYLKTNATLLLILNKNANGTDADLTWSDAQMNFYNVFRSTDPRVFNQIGSAGGQAYTDPNVLTDSNLYFYTVDEPGQ